MPTSLTIDETLLRRMARDASIYSLTRPWAVVMWIALTAALVTSILNLADAGRQAAALTAWLPVAVLALGAYAVWLTVASARRAVRAAMPPGAKVWVAVGDRALQIGSAKRTSEVPYSTFQSISARRETVLLKVRGASVVTAVPRALLSDEELTALRKRIG